VYQEWKPVGERERSWLLDIAGGRIRLLDELAERVGEPHLLDGLTARV
jgi:hypothetical protein